MPTLLDVILLALVTASAARVIEPIPAEIEGDDEFFPRDQPGIGLMMQMSYNRSIPVEALRACDKERAAACPSPSADGTHRCVALDDICDHRSQCPGGEDETPIICFFHEAHSKELARLRKAAIELARSVYQ